MKIQRHAGLAIGLVLALAMNTLAQQPPPRVATPLEPRPGDGATTAFGSLGLLNTEHTEYLFGQIPSAPPHAREYLQLHRFADSPTNAHWSNILARLAKTGDGFTVRTLEAAKTQSPSVENSRLIDQTVGEINERLAKEGTNPPPAVLVRRLERAALADITCNFLETSLVPWALASVRSQMQRPEVKSAIEKLSAYQPAANEKAGLEAAYKGRLAQYAKGLLKP